MKKKILFTCGILKVGGVQKSLIALLNNIDYELYDVDLMLTELKGEMLSSVPKSVNIIRAPEGILALQFSSETFIKGVYYTLSNFTLFLKYINYCFLIWSNRSKVKPLRQKFWSNNKNSIYLNDYSDKYYDVAISYAGALGLWNEFIIDKVKAKKKICWIHGNYSVFGSKTNIEKSYLQKFDNVITVTETAKVLLESEIPEIKDKVDIIYNIIDKNHISKLAELDNVFKDEFDGLRFVSVSRLDKGKGFDMAIGAMAKAINKGCNIKWYILGGGAEYENLNEIIKRNKMQDNIFLCGTILNPYPYIKFSDVFFHPSKGEGKSMSVDEAKLLEKPILITDYPTVNDQIEDSKTGLIVPISAEGLYRGIMEIYRDPEMRKTLSNNLSLLDNTNKTIDKFLNLIK